MKTKKVVFAVLATVLVFASGFLGGVGYGRSGCGITPQGVRSFFALEDEVARQLLAGSGSWYARREWPVEEMKTHSLALAKSRPCPECSNTWEAWGSQDYYSVPVIATFSDQSGDEIYEVVTGTAFHVDGRPVTCEPRMVIYYATRSGYAARVDENDQVWRRVGKDQWVLIDDPEQKFASQLRQKVHHAIWRYEGRGKVAGL